MDIKRMMTVIENGKHKVESMYEINDILYAWLIMCGHKRVYIDMAIEDHFNGVMTTAQRRFAENAKQEKGI